MPTQIVNKKIDIHVDKKAYDFFDGKSEILKLGSGDSFYIPDFLKKENKELFEKIMEETKFVQMFNIGKDNADPIPRLVTAQSDRVDDGSAAIYRMPGCNEKNIATTPWTPTVKYICDQASEYINQKLNHCVLTLFRNQEDSLAFHKDKLVDIVDNSLILSISFGDTRPIIFHEVDGKNKQMIMLKPGSLLAIGPQTNKRYMHAIPKINQEVGPRVSLSFRSVASYIKYDNTETEQKFTIIGKGAEFQTANYPFTKSHDNESFYSENVKKQINQHVLKSV